MRGEEGQNSKYIIRLSFSIFRVLFYGSNFNIQVILNSKFQTLNFNIQFFQVLSFKLQGF